MMNPEKVEGLAGAPQAAHILGIRKRYGFPEVSNSGIAVYYDFIIRV